MVTTAESSRLVWSAVERLDCWLALHEFAGYDPFDGLNSRLRPLAVGRAGRQALQQVVLRSPINLRPILGVEPAVSSKGMGYFARGYLGLHRLTGDASYLAKADRCLTWLLENNAPHQPGLSWGNHFEYQSRAFHLPRGVPTVVWTALIGHAFVESYELRSRSIDLDAVSRIAEFMSTGLERRDLGAGTCISYVPHEFVAIHNANALAAGFLARASRLLNEPKLAEVARAAAAYTVGAQLPNGAWWYGEESKYHWVDNWHTGYVLDSLWWYTQATGDTSFRTSFDRGGSFWLANFFLPDGTPKFYADRTFPIDIQCAGQSIESLSRYGESLTPAGTELAGRVARWTIDHMQDRDGHFYFRQTRRWTNRTPMLHWGQATMFLGLVEHLLALARPVT